MSEKNIALEVAQSFKRRAENTDLKGKARDKAALEFVAGALAGALAAGADEKGKEVTGLSMLGFLVSMRGYSELEAVIKKGEGA